MVEVNERKPVVLPDSTHILDWTTQDTVNAIMDLEPDDEYDDAVLDFLVKSSTAERIVISNMIAENQIGHRHLIEAVVEEIISGSQQRLKGMLENEEELPEPDELSLKAVNGRRIFRNLIAMNINEMILQMDGDEEQKLRQRLTNAPLDRQEALEQAILETVAENRPAFEELKRRIFRDLQAKLENTLGP